MSVLLADATLIRRTLATQWDVHVKMCGTCRALRAPNQQFCDEGWELAKQLQAAKARVAELQDELTEGHARLF